jgi:hypothetical protein
MTAVRAFSLIRRGSRKAGKYVTPKTVSSSFRVSLLER